MAIDQKMAKFRLERSPAAPATSDVSGDRGRRIVCADASGAKPGALLLRTAPFAALLDAQLWATHCHRCFRSAEDLPADSASLSRCGRCRTVYYCSRTCQQQDWKPDHQAECPRLPQLASLRLRADQISSILLLGRVVRRLLIESAVALSDENVSPLELVWDEADCSQETELLAALAQKLGFVDEKTTTIQGLQRLLSRFQNNNVAICDPRLLPVGAGCFPLGAIVNHSCSPNAVATFEPLTHAMQFRAIEPIAANEEITHAYVDVALPRTERQQRLQRRYHFSCACKRCSSPINADDSLDRFLDADVDGIQESKWAPVRFEQVSESMKLLEQAGDVSLDVKQRQELLKKARRLQDTCLHEDNIQRLSTLSQLFSLQLEDPGSLKDAIQTGTSIMAVYERVYPANHAMKGLHLFTLGDLCIATDQNELAKQYLSSAIQILRVSHGESHAFVSLLQQRLAELH